MRDRAAALTSLLLTALLLAALALPLGAAPYSYHTYDSMVSELEALAAAFPELTEHYTAQDRFGLPPVPDGADLLEQHVLRIAHEASGLDKPEVLLLGVQHGDEVVGLEVCLALARLLLESYGTDPWLTELVERREIYLMPLANPHGFANGVRWSPGGEGTEDMNRDHPYDRECSFFCSDEETLSTVGARAIHELARRHLFRVMLDYHGGVELILHPWGSPLHSSNTRSPDHKAADTLGQRMRTYGGPFAGFYPVGTAGDLLGEVNGPLDDSSYATSWDAANADPMWPTLGWRALGYTIEISDSKRPPASTLGGDVGILTPNGAEDGYVPKNVRIGLAAIDIAEPYVLWTNRDQLPAQVLESESVVVEWQVRGCFEIDETRVRWGTDPDPLATFDGETTAQSGSLADPCFGSPETFTASLAFPGPGTYHLTPAARVDASLLEQTNTNPAGTDPQTWVVRSRTEDGFFFQNATDPAEVNTVTGRLYWGAPPLQLEVLADDSLIFRDSFESGDTTAWQSTSP